MNVLVFGLFVILVVVVALGVDGDEIVHVVVIVDLDVVLIVDDVLNLDVTLGLVAIDEACDILRISVTLVRRLVIRVIVR